MTKTGDDDRDSNRFRLLVESVKDCAIFMLDCEGRVTWGKCEQELATPAAEGLLGGGGMAGPKGRLAVLGERDHLRAPLARRQPAWICEGDPGPHRAEPELRDSLLSRCGSGELREA